MTHESLLLFHGLSAVRIPVMCPWTNCRDHELFVVIFRVTSFPVAHLTPCRQNSSMSWETRKTGLFHTIMYAKLPSGKTLSGTKILKPFSQGSSLLMATTSITSWAGGNVEIVLISCSWTTKTWRKICCKLFPRLRPFSKWIFPLISSRR